MKPAEYSLIQYVADPARGEPLNVGIVAWDGIEFYLAVDRDAMARVVREHPRLHRDALYELPAQLSEDLERNRRRERTVRDVIHEQRGYPLLFSEPRYTTIREHPSGLEEAVARLVSRTVHPQRRAGGGADIFDTVERELRPLLAENLVARDYVFRRSRTGVHRRVDYFANTGADTALDVIKLNLKRAEEIRLRADAEAYKILDISAENSLHEFIVVADFSNDPELREINGNALQILQSADESVRVVTEVAAAHSLLSERAKHH